MEAEKDIFADLVVVRFPKYGIHYCNGTCYFRQDSLFYPVLEFSHKACMHAWGVQ